MQVVHHSCSSVQTSSNVLSSSLTCISTTITAVDSKHYTESYNVLFWCRGSMQRELFRSETICSISYRELPYTVHAHPTDISRIPNVFLPSIPWRPRVFTQLPTAAVLNQSFHVSNIEIVPNAFFAHRRYISCRTRFYFDIQHQRQHTETA